MPCPICEAMMCSGHDKRTNVVRSALEKITPVLGNKKKLLGVMRNLTTEEKSALKEDYLPLVSGKPHWKEDQEIARIITPLLNRIIQPQGFPSPLVIETSSRGE